jgi:hypothetical protein
MSKISEGVKEVPAGLGSPSPAHAEAKKADIAGKTELKPTANGFANGVALEAVS